MQTPYQLLNVAPEATDAEIKQAYLQQVKNNPPDRDQEKFQEIQAAYEAIKEAKNRVSYTLFTLPKVDFNELIDHALQTEPMEAITAKQFEQLVQLSVDEQTLVNYMAMSTEK